MPSQTATIVVTDLVGSTELRARLGEEQAERLRRLHDRLVRGAIETHRGSVVKGLGDGVLATFPEANGAVAAAVAIQQAADAHTGQHPDLPLVLRVGLSAGDVTLDEGDCFGAPVIEATRLCAAGNGGQILVADVVRMLARWRGRHEFTGKCELHLKGLAEPVVSFEVQWRRPAGSAVLPFPWLLGTVGGLGFAGRTSDLEVLRAAWKEASAGGRQNVVVSGEPGVGKTHLAAEFARQVHEDGGAVLYGRCEEHLGVPYEPFVEALAFFCEHTPAHDLRPRLGRYPGELVRLFPNLRELVPGLDPPLRSDPETEQYRLFESISSWLGAAGEAAGLLLVVDDLHWAAPPTLRLFLHTLRAAGPARLLIVGAFRDTEVDADHPLTPVLADLRRTPGSERIFLEGLTVEELRELLERLPRGHVDTALAATLHQGTEGNPFFVGEIIRHVADSGVTVEAMPVPEGVREVIMSRVARLPAATRQLVGVAAVLGRDVELGPLAAVGGVDEDAAIEALDDALAARLIEEIGAGAYRFGHFLARSAIYDSISSTRRSRLHLRAADLLDQSGGEDAAHIARHLLASAPLNDPARTARACLQAGDRALSMLADAEAASWYGRGLEVGAGEIAWRIRADLLIGLGEAQRRTGDAASRQTLIDAGRFAAAHGDVARLVRAVLANNRGMSSIIGHVDEERLELIATALDRVGPEPSGERAELLALHAAELLFGGEMEGVVRAADEARTIAAELDSTVQARVGVRRFLTCVLPDRVPAMVAEAADVVRFSDRSGDPQLQALSRGVSVNALLGAGALAEAEARAAEAMAIADETGQPALRSIAHFYYACTVDALGDHAQAAGLTQAAFDLGQAAAMPDAGLWYGARMWLHFTFEGQAEVAASIAAQGFAEFPRLVTWQAAWALDLAVAGHSEELAGFLPGLAEILDGFPVDLYWLTTMCFFATAQGFGPADHRAAARTYELLLPHHALHAAYGIGYFGPVEMALAIVARVLGDVDGSLAHHEAAAAAIDACGAARARALNGYHWAVTLLARNGPGDRQQATGIAEETLSYCQTKGYTTLTDWTERLLATLH